MGDIEPSVFLNFFIYLAIPFILAAFAKKAKLPPVIGYMLGGVVIGNLFTDLISRNTINSFASFGIILLLFTVGLEVNFQRMLVLKRFIVFGGFLQILITALVMTLLSLLFDFNLLQSFLIGLALTSSSTSLVAKIIQDRGEEGSFLGEIVLGILMFQDLAFIPFIIIFDSIRPYSLSFLSVTRSIVFDLFISSVLLWAMFYLGKKTIPLIFDRLARFSRELLNFFIIVFIFLVAFATALFKIPILVGVFMAGVLVSQTQEHYHIFSRIRPLRDILATIFFIYIGSNVDLSSIASFIPKITIFSLSVILLKGAILLAIFLFMKFSSRMAFFSALSLFQISENSFILMSVAFANRIFSQEQYVFIISSTLLSLILTPVLISRREKIYLSIRSLIKKYLPFLENFIKYKIDRDLAPIDVLNLKGHVILCGYGRIGSQVGRALSLANIPFVAIDHNFHTIERAKKEGVSIIYGDPTDIEVLDYVECENALALVSAVNSRFDQEAIIINAKKLNKDVFIISKVHIDGDQQRLRDLGAQTVVQPELEASISIIKKIFLLKKMDKEEIVKWLKHMKLIHGVI